MKRMGELLLMFCIFRMTLAVSSASDWSISLNTFVYTRDYHFAILKDPLAIPLQIISCIENLVNWLALLFSFGDCYVSRPIHSHDDDQTGNG